MTGTSTSAPGPTCPPGARGRWLRRLGAAVVVGAFVYGVVVGCVPFLKKGIDPNPAPETFGGPVSDIEITQARAEAIDLLLGVYDAVTSQAGMSLGPPPAPGPEGGGYQARPVTDEPVCPAGTTNEWYALAVASQPTVTSEEVASLMETVEPLAASYGFEPGPGYGSFSRSSDGAVLELVDPGMMPTISITTGCHTGTAFQEWPAGTEDVPAHLRTTGRGRADGRGTHPDLDIWPAQTPSVPVPASPEPDAEPAEGGAQPDASSS